MTRHWNYIGKFCEAFEPMFILTLQLQKNHVPLSQFYIDWLTCMAKLKTIKSNTLAKKLMKAMELRIQKLSTNMAFKACLYLDPRFNYIGSKRISSEDKEAVQVIYFRSQQQYSHLIICTLHDTFPEIPFGFEQTFGPTVRK